MKLGKEMVRKLIISTIVFAIFIFIVWERSDFEDNTMKTIILGCGVLLFAYSMLWESRASKKDKEFFKERDNGRIRMEGTNRHRIATGIAAVLSLIFLWIFQKAIPVLEYNEMPSWYRYFLLIPIVISVGIAGYYWKRCKNFGVSVLELTPCPIVAGQPWRGMVHIPCHLDSEVYASLRYVHQYTVSSGKSRIVHEDNVWMDTKQVSVYRIGENASAVKVEWGIGQGYASTVRLHQNGYWWELTLRSKVKGINYKASFEVPVKKAVNVP